jgi:hypothetical protein
MKNVTFSVQPKNGAFVNARLSTLHHSAETRLGFPEAMFACLVVVAVVGFTLLMVR